MAIAGNGKPPMFGDFEAQRHWMEITYNLPINKWYFNSSSNDLMYWGLDYPPLTAYHSWLCGYVANLLNSSWVELRTSHGLENATHKLFMRYTVVVADILVYMTAVFVYFKYSINSRTNRSKYWYTLLALLYPGLILIDHGHFQYNCISLGLTLWAVVALSHGQDVLGSIAFVLALNYKQMELFHAMPFFCYLFGKSVKGKENWFWKLTKVGTAVIVAFLLCWWPFLHDKYQVIQVLHRVFPFSRGLFEDKVANFWCSISVVVKLKQMYDVSTILRICLFTILVFLFPSSLHLMLKPTVKTFKLALINSSLIFFMFSYQVHEKSILIVALPVMLVLHDSPQMCRWFLQISTFSMLPLLIKDGLVIPTFSLMGLYSISTIIAFDEDGVSHNIYVTILEILSMLGALSLSVISITTQPPPKYPDLWPVLVSLYSAGHFLFFLLYFHYWQFTNVERSDNVELKLNQSGVRTPKSRTPKSKVSGYVHHSKKMQ